jgi:hypothetical protein
MFVDRTVLDDDPAVMAFLKPLAPTLTPAKQALAAFVKRGKPK